MTVLGGAPGGEQAVGGTPQPAPPEAFPAQPFVTVLPPGPSAAHALVHPSAGASQRQQLREVLRLAAAQQGGWGADGRVGMLPAQEDADVRFARRVGGLGVFVLRLAA